MRLPSISISIYVLGFIASVGFVLIFVLLLFFNQLDELQQKLSKENLENSKTEIEISTNRLVAEIQGALEQLSNLEGAPSAFSSSVGASRWINLKYSHIVERYPFITDLMLYDQTKKRITSAAGISSSNELVRTAPEEIFVEDPTKTLVIFSKDIESRQSGKFIGSVGVLLNLRQALRETNKYIFTDEESISVDLAGNSSIKASKLSQVITAVNKESPVTGYIYRLLKDALFKVFILALVLSIVFYLVLSKSLIRPLRGLSLHIDRMRKTEGALQLKAPAGGLRVAELDTVRESLNSYQSELDDMHHNLASKTKELWNLAHHDVLTGSFNRRAFEEDWDKAVKLIARNRIGVCLMLFDCDRFKLINDTYGHQVGDRVIQIVSRFLENSLRQGDRLYRLGGDEFATLLVDADVDQAIKIAKRCLGCIEQESFARLGINEPVRFSVGVSYAKETEACTLDLLHRQADIAMYHAKRPSNQKLVVFQREMDSNSDAPYLNSVVDAVYRAVAEGHGLRLHYQPVVNLRNGQADFYEALSRIDTTTGLILPSVINTVISAREMEVPFDRAVLNFIIEQLKSRRLPEGVALSINLSGPSILETSIVEKLMQLSEYNTKNPLLLEVTETSWIPHLQQASINLKQLRNAGYRVILDDFGSGFSSLNYLAVMPVDLIKVDTTLIRNLSHESGESQFVTRLVKLLLDAGYILVAEGIETGKSLNKVVEVGFSHGQGFLFGKPSQQCRLPEHTDMLTQPQAPIQFH